MYPIIYSTPWFNVYSYGLMIALGYCAGTIWIVYIAHKEGLPGEAVFDMLLLQMIVGILGSRFLYLYEHGELFAGRVGFFEFEKGGLTFYGAIISSILFDLIFIKFKRMPFWHVMDCVGNGLMLGIAIARVGCFLNGCCYGTTCSWPWGTIFPTVGTTPVHPTQIYESIAALVIFILNQKIRIRRRSYGQVFIFSLSLYAIFRFCVEFWRADNPIHYGLTLSQWLSLVMLGLGAVCFKIIESTPSLRVIPNVNSNTGV